MGRYVFKLPDVGEGTAEAEIVAWHVKVGDRIERGPEPRRRDDRQGDGGNDLAGFRDGGFGARRTWRMAAVGSPLVELEVEGAGSADARAGKAACKGARAKTAREGADLTETPLPATVAKAAKTVRATGARAGAKPLASPAVRQRAHDLGIELQFVPGSGPGGRIGHEDLEAYIAGGGAPRPRTVAQPSATASTT